MATARVCPEPQSGASFVSSASVRAAPGSARRKPTHRPKGSKQSQARGSAGGGLLTVVATPIGNAGDISIRAIQTLKSAAVIACEDTRVTGRLMARLGIDTPLIAYHDHNAERMRPAILARLAAGETVALVSDAGTPLVSDPGYKLVRAAVAEGVAVTTVPGPSAALAALVLSGLPSDRFLFAGFLPAKSAARRRELAELAAVPATLVFFESANRLADSLADMAVTLPGRDAAVAREITKIFEEVRRGPLADLAGHYAEAGAPKGEVVVVVGPPAQPERPAGAEIDRLLAQALKSQSLRDAVDAISAATGLPRRDVYGRALRIAGGR
jgi:16S rRNA (cytidine1402-2'-O)-methyltransferase